MGDSSDFYGKVLVEVQRELKKFPVTINLC